MPVGIGLSHLGVTLDGASHWGLPAAYGTALVGVAAALVRWRFAWPTAPAALPPVATLTIIAAVWAAGGTAWEWYPSIAAVGAAGYLVIAQLDIQRSPRIWGAAAGASAILALVLAHIAALNVDAEGAALPLTYTIVLAATAGAFVRWRWREAVAALPPLATLTASSTWWAAGGHWEWYAALRRGRQPRLPPNCAPRYPAARALLGSRSRALGDRGDRLRPRRNGVLRGG